MLHRKFSIYRDKIISTLPDMKTVSSGHVCRHIPQFNRFPIHPYSTFFLCFNAAYHTRCSKIPFHPRQLSEFKELWKRQIIFWASSHRILILKYIDRLSTLCRDAYTEFEGDCDRALFLFHPYRNRFSQCEPASYRSASVIVRACAGVERDCSIW